MRNHVKLGVSPRILYCVMDTGYGLGGSLGIADLHCQKVKSTKWLKHKQRVAIGGQ